MIMFCHSVLALRAHFDGFALWSLAISVGFPHLGVCFQTKTLSGRYTWQRGYSFLFLLSDEVPLLLFRSQLET